MLDLGLLPDVVAALMLNGVAGSGSLVRSGDGRFDEAKAAFAEMMRNYPGLQIDIGLVLTVGSLVSLVGQMPGGALVDAARSERLVAGLAIIAIAMSALAYATSPIFAVILAAAVLHSAASCVLGPAMAAISLGLVGHAAISERLGRPVLLRSAMDLRPPPWAPAGIFCRPVPCSSSPQGCLDRLCSHCA
jgi:MFS family permease